jgi:hypothetical protein
MLYAQYDVCKSEIYGTGTPLPTRVLSIPHETPLREYVTDPTPTVLS